MRFVTGLLVALLLSEAAAAASERHSLTVPYLSQTEALCGGAAAAMVLRYWGDRHADVQQFAPFVDRRAGGIAQDVLVNALAERHWQATALAGSLEMVRQQLTAGRPLILLIEDRPGRFHYVVAVSADDESVYVHDPVWGPSRRLTTADLMKRWGPADYWALMVLPPPTTASNQPAISTVQPAAASPLRDTPCDGALAKAIATIKTVGVQAADAALLPLREQCPDSARVVSELAAVRFAQERYEEAAALANDATARDPADAYPWNVLASSRFMLNDLPGALRAWNQIDKPRVDLLHITGLSRTRHSLLARVIDIEPNALLTESAFRLAARRLRELPNHNGARLSYRPGADGFAVVDVAIAERAAHPAGVAQWAALGAQVAINREIGMTVPGWTGGGEAWSVSGRWWEGRRRTALEFRTPADGPLKGVWHVEGSWEEQGYAVGSVDTIFRETQLDATLAYVDWLTPDLRYRIVGGLIEWNGERRAVSLGAALERRFASDRVVASAAARTWTPISGGERIRAAGAHLTARSNREARGLVHSLDLDLALVTAGAPFALWPGAGEGQARTTLLRAHPLLTDSVVRSPVFGRRLLTASVESVRWLPRPSLARIGVAGFVDTAYAGQRLTPREGPPLQVDAGAGVRVRLPGESRSLRFDYTWGLRDGERAFTLGWTPY